MSTDLRITVRNGERNYGPYSVDQVNSLLVGGRLQAHNLAWVEGQPEWQPLHTVPGVLAVPPVAAAPLADDESDLLIMPAFLLAFFLGVFGVHRFYVGKTGSGLAMLLVSLTVIGLVVTAIWATVDWILIVCGSFTDGDGRRLRRWN